MSDAINDQNISDDVLADEWARALEEQEDVDATKIEQVPLDEFNEGGKTSKRNANKSADFGEMAEGTNLDVILDIPVTISMEVGTTQINIRNLLQLNQGSVIELDRVAGEPLDVMINGTLIAHGEVVVVNEKFGIRLTDIISQAERIKKIN
jgi:flagellar motor switch protein FliN/FliY